MSKAKVTKRKVKEEVKVKKAVKKDVREVVTDTKAVSDTKAVKKEVKRKEPNSATAWKKFSPVYRTVMNEQRSPLT